MVSIFSLVVEMYVSTGETFAVQCVYQRIFERSIEGSFRGVFGRGHAVLDVSFNNVDVMKLL